MHANVQGLRSKINEINLCLESRRDIGVFGVTEHWCESGEIQFFNPVGFCLRSSFERSLKKGGGSALFVRDDILSEPFREANDVSIESICEISAINVLNHNLVICCLYRPPATSNFEAFIGCVDRLLSILCRRNQMVVLMGDLNIHFESNDNLAYIANRKRFVDLLDGYGLHVTLTEITRKPTGNQPGNPSCLDVMFTNFDPYWYRPLVSDVSFSDHHAIELILFKSLPRPSLTSLWYRRSKPENLMSLRKQLYFASWFPVYQAKSLELASSAFLDIFFAHLDAACPWVEGRFRSAAPGLRVVFSKDMLDLRNKYQGFRDMAASTRNEDLNVIANDSRRSYRRALASFRREFYDEKIKTSSNKAKASWDVVNMELNRKTRAHILNGDLNAQEFSKAFSENFELYSAPEASDEFSSMLGCAPGLQCSFVLSSVTVEDVYSTMLSLKNTNGSDFFGLNTKMLKAVADTICEPLTYLINRCFSDGCFPSSLKISVISPIPKKGNTRACSDFRPISKLPLFVKIIESLVLKQLNEFLEKESIIHPQQFGFCKGKSTVTAAASLIIKALQALEDRQCASLRLYDLSKAFDLVPHNLLMLKMAHYGFGLTALSFFESFLRGWRQVVVFNGKLSSEVDLPCGVKQGSILGPCCFLLFINDLLHQSQEVGDLFLFADDITALVHAPNEAILEERIGAWENLIERWCSVNGLLLNGQKTQRLDLDLGRRLDGQVTFLGLEIDSRLSWNPHVQILSSKLSSCNFMLRRLALSVSRGVLRTVFFACFMSRASYGILLWGNSSHARDIFILQKRAIRILMGLRWDECPVSIHE
uniref:Putative RNA-directed DNA polymerase from transposon X-element n=1 Tax=Lygus hesperus TaxID=30085 RepID=A0A146KUR3_LYGHE